MENYESEKNISEQGPIEQVPLVSVIIPVYNKEETIERTLRSIAGQTLPAERKDVFAEIIFVDDGSTDGTSALLQSFLEKRKRTEDRRMVFRYIYQENAGVSEARNHGLREAKGKYIAFMDGDDWAEPDWLLAVTEAAERHDADLVICGTLRHKDHNKFKAVESRRERILPPAAVVRDILRSDRLECRVTNKLVRAERIRGKVRFDPAYTIGEDLKFCAEIMPYCEKCVQIAGMFYHYDEISGGAMNSIKTESFRPQWFSEWNAVRSVAGVFRIMRENEKVSRRMEKRFIREYRIKQMIVALKMINHLSKDRQRWQSARKKLIAFVKAHKRYLVHMKLLGWKRELRALCNIYLRKS